MIAATELPPRIVTLDIVRGVAVMGILAMNIVGFALPEQAYVNPMAAGGRGPADIASWALGFVLIDGKMRGLFSFLFGASLLLVIQRAEAKGEPAARIHFRRMAWLLLFGLVHFYFIWSGDILSLYAPVGMIAGLFIERSPRALVRSALILILVQFLMFGYLAGSFYSASAAAAAPGAGADALAGWTQMKSDFVLPPAALAKAVAVYRGGYVGIVEQRFGDNLLDPLVNVVFFGWETLAYMLLGMAGLKSGFLTGAWPRARYVRAALLGYALSAPAYALFAWAIVRDGFQVPSLFALEFAASVLVRPPMIVGLAALIILLTERGGPLVDRIAAAGRAAFTNYLGTSLAMTALFYGYGFGLFGLLSRAQLWLVVLPAWAAMLLWSKPWLDRYRYGPFEWLWRSLARGALQPMRR
jgi:uncharacterized protein